jgi:hypothetical protein
LYGISTKESWVYLAKNINKIIKIILPFRAFSYHSSLIACLLPVHLFSFCDFGEDSTKIKKMVKPFCSFSIGAYVLSASSPVMPIFIPSLLLQHPIFPFCALYYWTYGSSF